MRIVPDLGRALDAALAAARPNGAAPAAVYAIPTYTAMLELRRILVRRGAAAAFWRDG
jgi:UDP-N-acetylmuramyl tripeptide synthase